MRYRTVIPEVGPVLFATGTAGAFFLQQKDKEVGAKGPDKIVRLEKDLFQRLKKDRLDQYSATLETLETTVKFCVEEGIFEMTGKDDITTVQGYSQTLKKHAFGADADALQVMISTLKKGFHWPDNDIQEALVAIIPFMVQCMELKLVLDANLVHIHLLRQDNLDEAQVHEFRTGLHSVSFILKEEVKKLREWIQEKKEERKRKLVTEIKEETLGTETALGVVREAWGFTDNFSGRTFRVSGVQRDIYQSCYMEDVDKKMKSYLSRMSAWYAERLQEHINKHFTVLEQVMEKWSKVAKALDDYWTQQPGRKEKPLNGPLMFRQMRSMQAASS